MKARYILLLAAGALAGCDTEQEGASGVGARWSGHGHKQPLGPGAVAPAIEADGWLGLPASKASSLAGRVVVVDVWAYW